MAGNRPEAERAVRACGPQRMMPFSGGARISNTRTDPFRAPVKSWAYKAAAVLGGCGERMDEEPRTNTVPMYCENVGFGREHLHASEGFEGRNVHRLMFHSWT